MNKSPLVSVIAICFNHSKYLDEALNSIKNQTYQNIELIIIDSNSSDDSVKRIEDWIKNSNVKTILIKQNNQRGLSENLNKGLKLCNGDFVQVLATDDKLDKSKIERQASYLILNPECGIVFSNAYLIDENSVVANKMYQNQKLLEDSAASESFEELIFKKSFIIPHSALIRVEVYQKVGAYDESLLIEDWDFFLRAFKKGIKVDFISEVQTYYRISSNSMWNAKDFNLFQSQIRIFQKHDLFKKTDTILSYLNMYSNMKKYDFIKALVLLFKVGEVKWGLIYITQYYELSILRKVLKKAFKWT